MGTAIPSLPHTFSHKAQGEPGTFYTELGHLTRGGGGVIQKGEVCAVLCTSHSTHNHRHISKYTNSSDHYPDDADGVNPWNVRLEPPQVALSHRRDFTQPCRCESLKTYTILKRAATCGQRLAMGWTVRGSNSGEGRFSSPVQTGPGAHPASCTVGTAEHPPHLAPKLKEYILLLSLWAFMSSSSVYFTFRDP
jgi:hypothetical protein